MAKQNKPTKALTTNDKNKSIWICTGLNMPSVAKYPKVFEYLKGFDNNRKHLLLNGGTKNEQLAIMLYVLEEVRGLLHPDDYHLFVHKEISCLDTYNDKLKYELYNNVTRNKEDILDILRGKYHPLREGLLDSLGETVKKMGFEKYYNEVVTDLEKNNRPKETLDKINYKEISIQRRTIEDVLNMTDSCREDNTPETTASNWFKNYFTHLTKCEILSLLDISSNNYEVWLGYTSEIRRKDSKYKPDFIMATLNKGENIKNFPQAFTDMFEKIKLPSQVRTKKGELKEGGKTAYLSDKKLKPLLEQILKEYKDSASKLPDLAEIAHKQIKEKYGLRRRERDFKQVDYYSKSKLKMFLSTLRKTGKLRKTN